MSQMVFAGDAFRLRRLDVSFVVVEVIKAGWNFAHTHVVVLDVSGAYFRASVGQVTDWTFANTNEEDEWHQLERLS